MPSSGWSSGELHAWIAARHPAGDMTELSTAEGGSLVAVRWVIWPFGSIDKQPDEEQKALYMRLPQLLLERYPAPSIGIMDPGDQTEVGLTYDADNGRRITLEWKQDMLMRLTVETAEFGGPHADRIFDELMRQAVMEDDGSAGFYW